MINLLILLLLGKYYAHFYLSWGAILALLIFTIAIEHLFLYVNKRILYFSFSALSTAIGVMLMMVSHQLWIYMLVIAMGLLQKHFLVYNGRHFFNPSNFALLMALLLFYDQAHMVLGQLGDDLWVRAFVLLIAALILWRVERWVISVIFCLAYLFFEYFLIIRYDPVLIVDDLLDRFVSVSFIVFITFMLTDPRTTPKQFTRQILFAICIAFVAALLDATQGFRVQHLFLSLAFCTPWVVFLALWKSWSNRSSLVSIMTVIMLFVISAILLIESKPPYYFSMDG